MSETTQTVDQTRNQTEQLLEIDSLCVSFETENGELPALRDVSLDINKGETLGIAGESGSGKSTLALAVLQYLDSNGWIKNGEICYEGRSLFDLSKKELRSIRGGEIAHVPQNPEKSLNPGITVGEQIAESIQLHTEYSGDKVYEQVHEVLNEVNISDPEYNAKRYPHELSGGMQQRILLAMALSCNPDLLILDEPTTGLDVTTEAKILDLINDLKNKYNTTILLITHDLGVIAQIADTVGILYAGELMEYGKVEEIFTDPRNPYTKGLLDAIPKLNQREKLSPIEGSVPDLTTIDDGCIFQNRCPVATEECSSGNVEMETVNERTRHTSRCLHWEDVPDRMETDYNTFEENKSYTAGDKLIRAQDVKKHFGKKSFFDRFFGEEKPVKAVDGVSFSIRESETLALVGESGCGKSTLGSTLLDLLEVTDGTITYDGTDIASMNDTDMTEFRSETQMVFQNPHSSLNPQQTIYEAIDRPLKKFSDKNRAEREARVLELLEQVELSDDYADRYPHELSGGEQQRVAIARAFAAAPSFVVLDEPVSALDVSVQASIVNLLSSLRNEYGASYLFISHDLSVVNYISDKIAVMYLGRLVEFGSKEDVFEPPYHPYTRALFSSIPSPDPTVERDPIKLEGDVPSARDPPSGCPFHTRCPHKIGEVCEMEEPTLEATDEESSHFISCHLDREEMDDKIDRLK